MATTYEAIATVTVGSGGASSISFSTIPQTFTDILVLISARTNNSSKSGTMRGRFNGSTSNYTNRVLYGETTGFGSFTPSIGGFHAGYSVGSTSTANTFCNTQIYIPNYAGNTNKSIAVDSVTEDNSNVYQSGIQALNACLWADTAAITSLVIDESNGGTFQQYTTATLYGIKKD